MQNRDYGLGTAASLCGCAAPRALQALNSRAPLQGPGRRHAGRRFRAVCGAGRMVGGMVARAPGCGAHLSIPPREASGTVRQALLAERTAAALSQARPRAKESRLACLAG